jgi:hypothetical protein
MNQPRFEHDCKACVYLGQFKEYDLYFCPGEPTVICRYSSEEGDYGSGLIFCLMGSSIQYQEAFARAYQTPEYRESMTKRLLKHHDDFDDSGTQAKFDELVKIIETPDDQLPLLMHDVKYFTEYFEYLLKHGRYV